ncbi:sensor histidine kinase [Azospirillum rugosum]|uniref:histidine kinase n=1 Tax=Azospirillum rugosum TaxID=416170 RepID=A0ABS4SCS6_9PROT|nr:HAMP domain-containing sensor histidine kinase [Azospirillum rugosum]MBP2290379.1 signal transduction histidine kinase [Azospirillum rugosum]MDQ0527855.1 signal transduction histidine kinase [Azospirillum rugosum]
MDALVLTCDLDGRLRTTHATGAGLPELHPEAGRPFPMLFGPDAVGRALDLFADLRRTGLVLDRPLASPQEQGGTLYLSGWRDAEGLVLTVARAPMAVHAIAEQVAENDPALALRVRALGAVRPAGGGFPMDGASVEALFEEMSRLNSDLANAQRALAKANAELAASNEQKNRLMGMLAHDLRSPLQVVAGFAQILEERLGGRLEDAERSCLERIRESSLFMRHLVEDALSLAAVQAGRLRLVRRPTDLVQLVRRNVSMNRVLADGKAMTIELSVNDDAPRAVEVDPAKVEQVLNNLLSNAIKYSDRGALIRVTVGATPEGSAGAGPHARIVVADNGRGIPEAELGQLFQPFGRSGTLGTAGETTVGLGLYICRTIVEGHGGRISVDSAPGRGSAFTVDLPVGSANH